MSKRRKSSPKKQASKGQGRRSRSRSEKKNNQRKPAGGKLLRGRVQKNPRGFAFIIPQQQGFEDAFVSRDDAAALLDGDTVEFSMQHRGPKTSARIHRILERRTQKIIGQLTRSNRADGIVTANNEFFLVDGDVAQARHGDWVVAELEDFPTERRAGTARITESFGKKMLPKFDIPFTIARYGLREEFPRSITDDAPRYRQMAREEIASGGRRDLRNLPFVTIDGEDAKDFDDAILVQRRGDGFVLYVAIADVSFFVRPHTPLDKEARARATSVYFPGFCLPMLPEFLSNDLCSLRPQEDKLAMTAEIHFSSEGVVTSSKFYRCLIKTAQRLTYTLVHQFFENDADTRKKFAALTEPLENARALYEKLDKQRRARGVLDFDLPESKIEVDAEGRPTTVKRAPRYVSHKLIEEFMIAANRAVARKLKESGTPSLYRVHEAPSPEALNDLNMLLQNMGMATRVTQVTPRAFAQILEATAELKSASTVHHVILRLQKQARYMSDPRGHFGLSLADYTHFTSPIRRYPDLVVHRSLNSLSAGRGNSDEDYEDLGDHTSEMERRATEAERFIVRRKQCWYFLDRVGDCFDGTVSGVSKNGVFVSLGEMAAEGFVPLEFMDGYWQVDERHMCLRKRPGNETLALGDPLRVQILKVSVDENQITLGRVTEKE